MAGYSVAFGSSEFLTQFAAGGEMSFYNYLMNSKDLTGFWWPDRFPVSVVNKSNRMATDFNSYAGSLTDAEGVRVYSSVFRSDEYLRFLGSQSDQLSIECAEFGIFYFDSSATESAYGSEMRFFANNSSVNSGGFRIYRSGVAAGQYSFFSHATINQTVKSLTGELSGVVDGWNYFRNSVSVDTDLMVANFECSINGVVVGSLSESILYDRVSASVNSGEVAVYALDNFRPAFYVKSRCALTDADALGIFNRFKSEYGIV